MSTRIKKSKIVGLTGGIGAGKSEIAKFFISKSIPVYNSDSEAKALMVENQDLKNKLINLFGPKVYLDGELNRSLISNIVFEDANMLSKLNSIVHPVVHNHFTKWHAKQNSLFIVKESAILFESGAYLDCDYVVSVVSDLEIRLKRAISRDQTTKEKIMDRVNKQWSDDERKARADFIIENNGSLEELIDNAKFLYQQICQTIN